MSILESKHNVHFIGIGGSGMSGLAEILLHLGINVTGTDIKESENTGSLKKLGATVYIGHSKENIEMSNPTVVVYSTAINADNPERKKTRDLGIPLIRRAEMLAEIMRLKKGIAIAGSHGKTTSTAMLGEILKSAKLDPTIVVGGLVKSIGKNAQWGTGKWIVAEADESDGSFQKLAPEFAIVTNIDAEHIDHYKNTKNIQRAFLDFLDKIPFYGHSILCSDSELLNGVQSHLNKNFWTYGLIAEKKPDFLVSVKQRNKKSTFCIQSKKKDISFNQTFTINTPGLHNILNATGCALMALRLGVSHESIQKGFDNFDGVGKRFEKKGIWKGKPIYMDYAHHPTEIAATLDAATQFFESNVTVVYQPHRYTRTRDQWEYFADSFKKAEKVFCLPIYAGGEKKEAWAEEFLNENFSKKISSITSSQYVENEAILFDELNKLSDDNKPIFFMGAGDIDKIPNRLINGPTS